MLNDGHEVIVPPSVPVGAYTLEIKTYVNGTLVMDSSDSYFKIIDATTPVVSEQVKCVFNGATTEQRCYTATASDSPLSFGCSGIGTCVADVKGPKNTALTWKSSCGGYAYTTLDGNSEYANFPCGGATSSSPENTSLRANQSSVSLGAASTFGVLAGSTVTNTGPTTVTGNLGVSPGSAVTGFAPGIVNGGAIHVTDTLASQAKVALTIAYNDLAGRSTNPVSVAGNLGGSTLSPGLYKSTSSLEISSGNLTLDARGNANAVFVFQVASTLSVSAGRQVVLSGGAKAANIFWQVGTSANLGTNATFKGTILADQSISLQTGARVDGRLLARIGAVTLQSNTVTVPAN
ncbi:MAG: ice-binding family protein [Candidatus Peribacter sp.]|nr:ice-binding family protein [Candidatus Peribacter sp.]